MVKLEESIVLRPHQVEAIQNALRTGKSRALLILHGEGVVRREEAMLSSFRDNPNQKIIIALAEGTLCGNDCQNKQWLNCDSERVLVFEEKEARRLCLEIGKLYSAKELFEF